ncbi:Uncharacterised protein [Mycobacteroides abscessus subsp. abscessus]|nr:Uncharacterised protein [Mycobacteroides abscessus subsp. abscessus]
MFVVEGDAEGGEEVGGRAFGGGQIDGTGIGHDP